MNINKEKAIVPTSKFLQLRDELEGKIHENNNRDWSALGVGLGCNATSANIQAINSAINALCELLHEMIMED